MHKGRIRYIVILTSFCSLILIGRLYYLQVIRCSELKTYLARNVPKEEEFGQRGGIYDCVGRELALSVNVPSAYISTNSLEDPTNLLNAISGLHWVDYKSIRNACNKNRGFVWIKRLLTPGQKQYLDTLNIEQIQFISEPQRFYPHSDLAAHIIGFVGTEERGLEGLEYHLNRFLDCQRDKIPRELSHSCKSPYYFNSGIGYEVYLTIDLLIQYIAEEGLRGGCERFKAEKGLLLLMDTYTGEVLAMANWPGFNPNCFTKYQRKSWRNRCITDMYEPGSIFKVVCAAALLEEGLASLNDIIYCEQGSVVIAGRRIRDHRNYGWLSLKQVIENSSNIGVIKFSEKLSDSKFYDYIKRFGFGKKTGIEFPGEVKGLLRAPKKWSGLSKASISIGQEISVTPIQMITAFSALVNDGFLMKPRLLKQIRDYKGNVLLESKQAIRGKVISTDTSKRIKQILRGVVTRGTGKNADIPGYWIGGKTGTAQIIDRRTGEYSEDAFLASFLGFFPDSTARYTMLVMIYAPKTLIWGGEVAAPIFREVAEKTMRYLHISPKDQDIVYVKRDKYLTLSSLN